jgi:hypothetical protein
MVRAHHQQPHHLHRRPFAAARGRDPTLVEFPSAMARRENGGRGDYSSLFRESIIWPLPWQVGQVRSKVKKPFA